MMISQHHVINYDFYVALNDISQEYLVLMILILYLYISLFYYNYFTVVILDFQTNPLFYWLVSVATSSSFFFDPKDLILFSISSEISGLSLR